MASRSARPTPMRPPCEPLANTTPCSRDSRVSSPASPRSASPAQVRSTDGAPTSPRRTATTTFAPRARESPARDLLPRPIRRPSPKKPLGVDVEPTTRRTDRNHRGSVTVSNGAACAANRDTTRERASSLDAEARTSSRITRINTATGKGRFATPPGNRRCRRRRRKRPSRRRVGSDAWRGRTGAACAARSGITRRATERNPRRRRRRRRVPIRARYGPRARVRRAARWATTVERVQSNSDEPTVEDPPAARLTFGAN